MWEGEVLKALLLRIVSISCQLHWVIELNIPRSGGVAEWRRIGECCLGGAALQSPH